MNKLSLSVQYVSSAKDLPRRALFRRWVKAALHHDVQITLRIVDEDEGRNLNRDFRGKDYATNVLTFVYDEEVQPRHGGVEPADAGGAAGRLLYGDIVLCAPVVAREARAQRKDTCEHYAHLAIHAMLHLQGYEHEEEEDASEMEKLETAIMLKLGYADPYQVVTS